MTDTDITAQEARLVEAFRSIVKRDPWLADMVIETVLDVARNAMGCNNVPCAEASSSADSSCQ